METGLFFLLGTLSLVAGILSARFNKPIARALFVTALASFIVGVVVFVQEGRMIGFVVAEFEKGSQIVCTKGDTIYSVSKANGWKLIGDENFIKEDQNLIIWAKFCKASGQE